MKAEAGYVCCTFSVAGPCSSRRAGISMQVAMIGSCIYVFTMVPGALVRSCATLVVEALSNDRSLVSADVICVYPTEHDLR